jgi:hypothetical protein
MTGPRVNAGDHPDSSEILAYSQDAIAGERREELSDHFEHCDHCCVALGALLREQERAVLESKHDAPGEWPGVDAIESLVHLATRAFEIRTTGPESPQSGRVTAPPTGDGLGESPELVNELNGHLTALMDAAPQVTTFATTARDFCVAQKKRFGFDFATISMIHAEEDLIETVAASHAVKWTTRQRITTDERLRDIQADIVLNQTRAEVIAGWDDRFDEAIYTENHEEAVRVFAPIVVVRDADNQFRQDLCRWSVVERRTVEDERWTASKRHVKVPVLELECPSGYRIDVIGTIEAGFLKHVGQTMSESKVLGLLKRVTAKAADLYLGTLWSLLERITSSASKVGGADVATLHFIAPGHAASVEAEDREIFHRYCYQTKEGTTSRKLVKATGKIGRIGHRPRSNGLGRKALDTDLPQQRSGDDLKRINSEIFKEGVRTMIALPFRVGPREGIVYLHRFEERVFSHTEIGAIRALLRAGAALVQLAVQIDESRRREQQEAALRRLVETLETPDKYSSSELLLKAIAGNTRNILGADIVTIYKAIQRRAKGPPVVGGRLREPGQAMAGPIRPPDAPQRLIEANADVFAPEAARASFAHTDEAGTSRRGFVRRERVVSVAAVRLIDDETLRGVLFVNYRQKHAFSAAERQFVLTLAATVARVLSHLQRRGTRPQPRVDVEPVQTAGRDLTWEQIN